MKNAKRTEPGRENMEVNRDGGKSRAVCEHAEKKSDRQMLEENYSRILALEDSFESLYDVDPETGRYEMYIKGRTFGDINEKLVNFNEFFEDARKNIESVYPEDREGILEVLTPEYMRRELDRESHFDWYYRLLADGKPLWVRMRFVYKNSEKRRIIIGVFNAEGDVAARQIAGQKEQLEKQQIRNDLLFDTFHAGKWSYEISAEDEILSAEYSNVIHENTRQVRSGGKPMAWLEHVHPEDRERALEEFMATVRDHSGRTVYDTTFRMIGRDGKCLWNKSAGRILRRSDGTAEFLGMNVDITEQMEEQQTRLLGAVPLSPDIFVKANIGLWAFELDEGKAPRMYADSTMLGLLGLTHQISPEEIYHAWYDHIDHESYGLVTDAVEKMQSGEHAEVQYPWHHPDGHTMIVRCGGVRNPGYTKGIRIEGTHQDVTQTLHFNEEERRIAKQREIELVKSKLRADSLAFLADNEPDLDKAMDFFGKRILKISGADQVIFLDTDGRRIVLNAPGIQDIPREICAVCPFSELQNPVYGKDGIVIMNDCSAGCRGVMAHPDCPAKSSLMQHIYSGGRLAGLLTVHFLDSRHSFSENGIDIMRTVAIYLGLMIERINAKKAEIARIEAESSNKAKTEFLFNMSHDIRTPMNAIIGFTDKAVRNMNDPEVLGESLEKVRSSSEYLLQIINDILEMAKIESGKLELKETLHLGEKGQNALIEVFGAEAARKGIDFRSSYNIRDPYIWLDENRVNQIIANLISNAIKYTDPGGRVSYSIEQLPCDRIGYGRYRVSVEDTGRGMSPEFLSRIFNAFEREKSAIQSGEQGTGLGMAIVKKLADAMGGTVAVESEPGRGTRVCFTSEHRIATPEEIRNYRMTGGVQEEAAADFSGRRVLLVEDNALNREIAEDILLEEGMEVGIAGDGAIAVKMLREMGPDYYDFILMDIQMPNMNGYEATREIRRLYPASKIPIIALSANAFAEDRAASLNAGMNDHVAKPINIAELKTALAQFLQTEKHG